MATAASCAVTSLRGPKGATAVSDDTLHIILDLTEDPTQTKITGVGVQDVLSGLRRKSQYRGVGEGRTQSVESCRTTRFPHKWNILSRQSHQGCRDVIKICPRNGTDDWKRWHFVDFNWRPYDPSLSNIKVKLSNVSPKVDPKEIISSR